MKQIYLTATILIVIAIFNLSCEKDTINYDRIKIGKGKESLKSIEVQPLSIKNVILSGGNNKFKVNIADSKIAKVKIKQDTLEVEGILEGKTYATILSHNQKSVVNIVVKPNVLNFSIDEITIKPNDIDKTVTLGGGGRLVSVEEEDPDSIMDIRWTSKGVVEITAKYEGVAYVIAKSAGLESKRLKVKIRAIDDKEFLKEIGVYSSTSGTYYAEINPVVIVKNQKMGILFSGTTQLESNRNNYIYISPIIHPKPNEYINIEIKKSKYEGKKRVYVEELRKDKKEVVLRGRGFKLVLPYYD